MTTTLMMATALPMTPQPLSHNRLSSSQSEALGIGISLSYYSTPPSLSLSTTSTSSPLPFVYCGRGDKKTAKGKRFNHSFGNARPRDKKKGRGPPRIPVPFTTPKKDSFEETEVVQLDIDESLS